MNVSMKFKRLFICAIFFLSGVSGYSSGEDEVAKLRLVTQDVLDVLYEDKYKEYTIEEKSSTVRVILERNYDLTVIIRRTLGRNWKLLSPQEQSKVKELVTQLIVKAFIEGLQGVERPTVTYDELVTITDNRFEVPSVITFLSGKFFNVVYRFGHLKTGWQIYDIVAEEVSVVSNYRQQVDDHFSRNGTGAELIDKLEKLLEEQNLDEDNKL